MSALARQRRRALLLLFVPGFLYLVTVRIAPAVFTAGMSFSQWNLKSGQPPRFAGVSNYVALFHDAGFGVSLARSLIFTACATVIELTLGLAIAMLLNRRFPARRLVRTVVLAPMVITPAVVGMMWFILFHDTIGPLNWFLSGLDLGPVGWLTDPKIAMASVLLADVWHWTPFMFLLSLAALQAVPQESLEAASVDGATLFQSLRMVLLPAIADTLLVAAVLRAMEAFELFAEPYVMTGGGPGNATETISLHIYKAAFLFFDMGYAGAMIVVSIGILVALYSISLRLGPRGA
jgi:multiple sugar transport system permease protein